MGFMIMTCHSHAPCTWQSKLHGDSLSLGVHFDLVLVKMRTVKIEYYGPQGCLSPLKTNHKEAHNYYFTALQV